MYTGGGSILLEQALQQIAATHRKPEDFFFVPLGIASVLNAIGGVVLAQAAAQKVAKAATDNLLAQRRAALDSASSSR
jgi:hypothetical protein